MSQQEKKAVVTDGSDVPEESKKVAGETQQDPKNVGELTHYIQNMLQQMQDRSVRGRNLPSPPTSCLLCLQVPDHVGPDHNQDR